MRRIQPGPTLIAVALVAIGPARADDPPKAEAVDRVLSEWQEKAAAVTSIEVKYRMTTVNRDDRRVEEGRAVLAPPNLALVETGLVPPDGKPIAMESRTIWDGRSILSFQMDDRTVTRYPLDPEPKAAPRLLRLPFFYKMTVEEAKRDYDWKVLKQGGDGLLLGVTPKGKLAESLGFRSCVLDLDRETFLPRRMITWDVQGDVRRDFRAVDVRINQVDRTDDLTAPCLDAWTVSEASPWWTRFFLR